MKNKGFALITILLILALLAVMGVAITNLGLGNLAQANSTLSGERAYYAGEAGMALALQKLQNDISYAGESTDQPLVGSEDSFRVWVYHSGDSNLPAGVTLPSSAHCYVLSQGKTRTGLTRRVGVMLKISQSQFNYAAFAKEKVVINEFSTVGFYDSSGNPLPSGHHGHIATNLVAQKALEIGKGSFVDGNAYLPPGAPGNALTSEGTLAGEQISLMSTANFNPVALPSDPSLASDLLVTSSTTLPPGVYKDVTISGATLSLVEGGTYIFQSLVMNNDAGLGLTSAATLPTHVFVRDQFLINDGTIVNDSMKPPLLKVEVANGPVELKTSKGGDPVVAYYSIYAPNADVKVKEGSQLFGSIIGKKVEIAQSSKLIYDMQLRNGTGGAVNLQILSHSRL